MPTSDKRLQEIYEAFEVLANDINSKQVKNKYAIYLKNSIDLMLDLGEQYNAVIVSTNHNEELKEEFNFDVTNEQIGLLGKYKEVKIYGSQYIEPSKFYFTIATDLKLSLDAYKPYMSINNNK